MDEFLEILTENYQRCRRQALDFLRIIFEASDLNNDGYLELQEFQLLVVHIAPRHFSRATIEELFEEYC